MSQTETFNLAVVVFAASMRPFQQQDRIHPEFRVSRKDLARRTSKLFYKLASFFSSIRLPWEEENAKRPQIVSLRMSAPNGDGDLKIRLPQYTV